MYAQRGIPKPLLLPANLQRFHRFRPRMTVLVQDDADFREELAARQRAGQLGKAWREALRQGGLKLRSTLGDDWINEDHRKEAVLRWLSTMEAVDGSNGSGGAGASVGAGGARQRLFVFSDLDELPNGQALLELKHCVPNPATVRPRKRRPLTGRIAALPPERMPLLLPMETAFFDLQHTDANKGTDYSGIHVLSDPSTQAPRYRLNFPAAPAPLVSLGMHLSRCVRPAEHVLKAWLQAEASEWRSAADAAVATDVLGWYRRTRERELRQRGEEAAWEPKQLPWFVEHNKARFPYLFPSRFPGWEDYYAKV